MGLFQFVLEIIGTVAFAVSGAMVGVRKNMDVFGIAILGLTTAVGGGILRDLILGMTPPATFRNPVYALVAIATSIAAFLCAKYGRFRRGRKLYAAALLVMDSLGLGAFTVAGMAVAFGRNLDCGAFLPVFVGVITGVGGGVLRDVMAGETPYIFVKHVYACASLVGALVCVCLCGLLGENGAMLAGMASVVALRLLSAHFRWNLPKVCREEKVT